MARRMSCRLFYCDRGDSGYAASAEMWKEVSAPYRTFCYCYYSWCTSRFWPSSLCLRQEGGGQGEGTRPSTILGLLRA